MCAETLAPLIRRNARPLTPDPNHTHTQTICELTRLTALRCLSISASLSNAEALRWRLMSRSWTIGWWQLPPRLTSLGLTGFNLSSQTDRGSSGGEPGPEAVEAERCGRRHACIVSMMRGRFTASRFRRDHDSSQPNTTSPQHEGALFVAVQPAAALVHAAGRAAACAGARANANDAAAQPVTGQHGVHIKC